MNHQSIASIYELFSQEEKLRQNTQTDLIIDTVDNILLKAFRTKCI